MMLTATSFRAHVAHVVAQFTYPHNQVNLETLSALWEPAIESGVGRAYANTDGFLLAFFVPDPISGEKTAAQYLWMVSPQHRDGNAALDLFRRFESDARECGCQRIVSGCMAISDTPKMRKLYARLGYEPFSESFSKAI